MPPRHRALYLVLLVAAASIGTFCPAAADDMQWQFYESNDPDNKGAMTARLVYGVPETDNAQVMGVCDARPSTGVKFSSVTFGADIGDLANGAETDLRFSGGGFEHTLHGNIERSESEEGLSGVHLDIAHDDPLWAAFAEKDTLDYLVPGYRAATLQLEPGRGKIKSFVEACRTYETAIMGEKGNESGETNTSASESLEKDAFDSAKELGTVAAFEAFLSNYPSGFYADLARAYIAKLNTATAPDLPPPAPVEEPPAPIRKAAPPAPPPAEKKKAAAPKCRSRSILVDGKCILKENAAGYCGPGYRVKNGKCVPGAYVAPKVKKKSVHGCPPGQVWSAEELCHYDD